MRLDPLLDAFHSLPGRCGGIGQLICAVESLIL
jgi:hypothetical protein